MGRIGKYVICKPIIALRYRNHIFEEFNAVGILQIQLAIAHEIRTIGMGKRDTIKIIGKDVEFTLNELS